MSLESAEEKPQELWVNAQSKDGRVFKNIWNCTDIPRFQKEEPEIAKQIKDGLDAFVKVPGNIDILKDFYKGFTVEIGEWTYKVVQNNDGSRRVSRTKKGGSSSYTKKPFTVMRTTEVKVGRLEELSTIINNQSDTDNWEVVYLTTDDQGDKFMLLNKKPYQPPTIAEAKGDTSEHKEEGNEEENQSE